MSNNININTIGLIKHAEQKRKVAIEKVDFAIKNLLKNKSKINFNSVAQSSGVSKAYLYRNNDIRERIETLRNQQVGLEKPNQVKHEMTNSSKDILLAAKNKRIKQLEDENKLLKEQLMTMRGKLYDSL